MDKLAVISRIKGQSEEYVLRDLLDKEYDRIHSEFKQVEFVEKVRAPPEQVIKQQYDVKGLPPMVPPVLPKIPSRESEPIFSPALNPQELPPYNPDEGIPDDQLNALDRIKRMVSHKLGR